MKDDLDLEIEAFESMKDELLKHHLGKFVVFHNKELLGAYDNFRNAAVAAERKIGRKTHLIRQVTEFPRPIPHMIWFP